MVAKRKKDDGDGEEGSDSDECPAALVESSDSEYDAAESDDDSSDEPAGRVPLGNDELRRWQREERSRLRHARAAWLNATAAAAVPVRRGSMTTTLPPRFRISASLPMISGVANRLPWEAWGLAPMMMR